MPDQYLMAKQEPQMPNWEAEEVAQGRAKQLAQFLSPLLVLLDQVLDKRLGRTFLPTVQTIITFRDRANGLRLSELGGYLLTPAQAPAGTKWLSNLSHSSKWSSWIIDWFLWQQANQQLVAWEQAGYQAIVDWDESRLEKHESSELEGVSPVFSSKAARRTRSRKGYYHRPSGRICLPGRHWLAALLVGHYPTQGTPVLIAMRWWRTRGANASYQPDEEGKLLVELLAVWGRRGLQTFDRGFARKFWLGVCLAFKLRLAVRWRGDYPLLDATGAARASWKIAHGQPAWSSRQLWDA